MSKGIRKVTAAAGSAQPTSERKSLPTAWTVRGTWQERPDRTVSSAQLMDTCGQTSHLVCSALTPCYLLFVVGLCTKLCSVWCVRSHNKWNGICFTVLLTLFCNWRHQTQLMRLTACPWHQRNGRVRKAHHTHGRLTCDKAGTAGTDAETNRSTGIRTGGQLCEKNTSWLLPTPT